MDEFTQPVSMSTRNKNILQLHFYVHVQVKLDKIRLITGQWFTKGHVKKACFHRSVDANVFILFHEPINRAFYIKKQNKTNSIN